MNKKDFYYDLPDQLIAQTPVEPRDSSRLMVYNKKADQVEHKRFGEILGYLKAGDVLVINNPKVLPVRIYGQKEFTSARVEFLLLKRLDIQHWEILLKPARRVDIGTKVIFSADLTATIVAKGEGVWTARFEFEGVFEEILSSLGEMPLPPYIKTKLKDKKRYNTVYAKVEGSSAAPTAGLHFTPELLDAIKKMGIEIVQVTLNVGLGTFLPVKTEDIASHRMHSEHYELSTDTAELINSAKAQGRRIIAVGTTSVRVLESAADSSGNLVGGSGDTQIFIYPGYEFKVIDALITNFHLPESTLIMLVSAFIGRDQTLELYNLAVHEQYRFFSFGDSMLLY